MAARGRRGRPGLDAGLIVAALLGMVVAGWLWWAYFDFVALAAARRLRAAPPDERVRIARDSFTYLHMPDGHRDHPLRARGQEDARAHRRAPRRVPAVALCGGAALYLVALSAFKRRNLGSWNGPRLVAASALAVLAADRDGDTRGPGAGDRRGDRSGARGVRDRRLRRLPRPRAPRVVCVAAPWPARPRALARRDARVRSARDTVVDRKRRERLRPAERGRGRGGRAGSPGAGRGSRAPGRASSRRWRRCARTGRRWRRRCRPTARRRGCRRARRRAARRWGRGWSRGRRGGSGPPRRRRWRDGW